MRWMGRFEETSVNLERLRELVNRLPDDVDRQGKHPAEPDDYSQQQ